MLLPMEELYYQSFDTVYNGALPGFLCVDVVSWEFIKNCINTSITSVNFEKDKNTKMFVEKTTGKILITNTMLEAYTKKYNIENIEYTILDLFQSKSLNEEGSEDSEYSEYSEDSEEESDRESGNEEEDEDEDSEESEEENIESMEEEVE